MAEEGKLNAGGCANGTAGSVGNPLSACGEAAPGALGVLLFASGLAGMGSNPKGSFAPCISFCTSALRLSGSVGGSNSGGVTAAIVGFCSAELGVFVVFFPATTGFPKFSAVGDPAVGELAGEGELELSPPPPMRLQPPIKTASVVKPARNET